MLNIRIIDVDRKINVCVPVRGGSRQAMFSETFRNTRIMKKYFGRNDFYLSGYGYNIAMLLKCLSLTVKTITQKIGHG